MRVRFRCSPAQAFVTVYGAQGELIGSALNGSMLLLPGDYLYEAVCSGYVSKSGVAFTVAVPGNEPEPEQTVNVILAPAAEEEGFFEESDAELPLRSTEPEPLVVAAVEADPDRKTPTVFLQTDSRWAASPYPYSRGEGISVLAGSGCGILALTNAVYYLNDLFVDPVFAADYSAEAGFHAAGGTRWDFYRGFARTYGESYGIEFAGETDNYTDLKNKLLHGCAAICSVPGHIMALVDYDKSMDRFLLLDSSPEDLRATGAGYVWISEQELQAMPSRIYDYNGLYPRFILLRSAGLLDVSGLLDGMESDTLGSYGTFDVWVDGDKVANDQTDFHAMLPRRRHPRQGQPRLVRGPVRRPGGQHPERGPGTDQPHLRNKGLRLRALRRGRPGHCSCAGERTAPRLFPMDRRHSGPVPQPSAHETLTEQSQGAGFFRRPFQVSCIS